MSKTTATNKKPHRRKDARPTSPTALDSWGNIPPFTPAYIPVRANEFRRSDPHYTTGRKDTTDPRVFQQFVFLKAVLFLTTLALLVFVFGVVVNWLMPNAAAEFSSMHAASSVFSAVTDV